jgi:hypothetical protein
MLWGIFLASFQRKVMKKTLRKPGVSGTIVLYVGGMAELFSFSAARKRSIVH